MKLLSLKTIQTCANSICESENRFSSHPISRTNKTKFYLSTILDASLQKSSANGSHLDRLTKTPLIAHTDPFKFYL